MFTRSDLATLMNDAPELGVSIFLPTHLRSREIRQDPIRLKNLVAEARGKLLDLGFGPAEAEETLAPALTLIDDYEFWQHGSHGLALFLGDKGARHYRVPLPLSEQVLVGPGFHVKPLLPVLAADGAFLVLTITSDRVRLFEASRFALAEAEAPDLPGGFSEMAGNSDYESPVQASPPNRPHTVGGAATKAQVYGDSPEEWRKSRLVEFLRRTAAALQQRLASDPLPVVLVADAEAAGHFQKSAALGHLLAGLIETNPEAMDEEALHEAAYALVQPRLDADRQTAMERFQALQGSGDERVATEIHDVISAAYQGRVEALLLAEGEDAWGRYDDASGKIAMGEDVAGSKDLLDAAAVQTLRHSGEVHVLRREEIPSSAAILRY